LIPGYQEAVDRMVARLKAHDAGEAAPKPGERMPPFAMPDDKGQLVTLDRRSGAQPKRKSPAARPGFFYAIQERPNSFQSRGSPPEGALGAGDGPVLEACPPCLI
jgi:hypothetical protein